MKTARDHHAVFDVALGSAHFIALTYIQILSCSGCITSPPPTPNKPPPNPGTTQQRKIKDVDWPSAKCPHGIFLSAPTAVACRTGRSTVICLPAAFTKYLLQSAHVHNDLNSERWGMMKISRKWWKWQTQEFSYLCSPLRTASSLLLSFLTQSKYNQSTANTATCRKLRVYHSTMS